MTTQLPQSQVVLTVFYFISSPYAYVIDKDPYCKAQTSTAPKPSRSVCDHFRAAMALAVVFDCTLTFIRWFVNILQTSERHVLFIIATSQTEQKEDAKIHESKKCKKRIPNSG